MRQDRLVRALLPTWPPENAPEAMLLLLCAAALRLLIALWVLPESPIAAQPGVADAALAMLAGLLRPLALGLLLALAARVVFGVAASMALGLGAVLMGGTWAAALIVGLGGLPQATTAWLEPLCVALLAPAVAWLAGRGWRAGVLLGLVAGGLTVAVTQYDALHGWALDALGLSVRGALVFGLEHARREGLDAVPLLVACLAAWMVAGGAPLRRTLLLAWTGGAWPLAVAGSACVVWGYVRSGLALGALPGILQPPAVYGLLAFLAGLSALLALVAQVRAHRREGAPAPSTNSLGLLATWALGLTFLADTFAPAVALLIVLPLALPLLARQGSWAARPMGTLGGAALAVLLWMAGAAAVPGIGLPRLPLEGFLLAGLIAAGGGFAGLCAPGVGRPRAAGCIVLLCAGLAVLAVDAGRGDTIVLCAVMFLLLQSALLLPRRSGAPVGDAALGCLALLAVATALSVS